MDGTDDDVLYAQATGGDRAAIEALLARYLPKLHAYVHARLGADLRVRESTHDVVQSVCRELFAQHDAFEFRGEERFRAWLFTAALNKIRAKHRLHHAAKRERGVEQAPRNGDAFADVGHLLTPSVEAVGNETAAILAASLDALPPEHREVITLARVVGLPHAVTAEFLDRSEEAVRQLLARALLGLAREMRRRGIDVDRSGARSAT